MTARLIILLSVVLCLACGNGETQLEGADFSSDGGTDTGSTSGDTTPTTSNDTGGGTAQDTSAGEDTTLPPGDTGTPPQDTSTPPQDTNPPAQCGNGTPEGSEACDDGNTKTEACAYGETSCTVCAGNCTQQAGATTYCGDGAINGPESCDGGALGGATCASVMGSSFSGTVSCQGDCMGYNTSGCSQSTQYPASDVDLCDLVNAYRAENSLPAVPLSPALMAVARAHVEDAPGYFGSNPPSQCNLHSWSDNTPLWTGCCYTSDHAQADCMWRKVREITASWPKPFTGNGYENSARGYSSNAAALNGWKSSSGHNAVILNTGIWASRTWRSMGCGSDNGFYYLWFSDTADPNQP